MSHPAPDPARQMQDLQVVLDVARRMGAAGELETLLGLILDSAREVLRADRSTLFLYDAERNELYSSVSADLLAVRFPADRGIAGAAAMGRCTIRLDDVYDDPRFNRAIDRQTGYRTRSMLTVPLFGFDGQLVGVMQVLNKVDGLFSDYDVGLAEALAAQIGVALQRAKLLKHYGEKVQLENSLRIARDIQQGLLPQKPPDVPGYDIAGFSRPADDTGGDIFDFVAMADGRLALTVADASGHGIGPALVICETRALMRAIAGQTNDPGWVLTRTNDWLCADLTLGRFVTAFFGFLDPVRHRLVYGSAGHGPMFWHQVATSQVTMTGATGVPLGIAEGLETEVAPVVEFAPGDVGIILTDGYLEAENGAGEQFGKERLEELIRSHGNRSAAALLERIDAEVRAFMKGQPQLDDQTALVVRRLH